MNKIYAIRGAVTVEKDTEQEIREKSVLLINRILNDNKLTQNDCISLIISTTKDLTSFYPARAVREAGINIPLFSAAEPDIDGSLKFCIRMMLTVQTCDDGFFPQAVYLGKAKDLRPDLADNLADKRNFL